MAESENKDKLDEIRRALDLGQRRPLARGRLVQEIKHQARKDQAESN